MRERPAFEGLEVLARLGAHLLVEDFDAVETHPGGVVDALLDRDALALEVPEGIRGDADAKGGHAGNFTSTRVHLHDPILSGGQEERTWTIVCPTQPSLPSASR